MNNRKRHDVRRKRIKRPICFSRKLGQNINCTDRLNLRNSTAFHYLRFSIKNHTCCNVRYRRIKGMEDDTDYSNNSNHVKLLPKSDSVKKHYSEFGDETSTKYQSSLGTPWINDTYNRISSHSDLIDRILTGSSEEKYEFVSNLAQGGMGKITLVRDKNCQRKTVKKQILVNRNSSKELIIRFIREGQITAQLEHPNIVPVYEIGQDHEGQAYYTMKHTGGSNLGDILKGLVTNDETTVRNYPISRILNIIKSICDALAYAHSMNVVHRDLKPENIMVGQFGEVAVLDWGLAKILDESDISNEIESFVETDLEINKKLKKIDANKIDIDLPDDLRNLLKTYEGAIAGTPEYMAPEQLIGDVKLINRLTDIYGLGAILYSALTLKTPQNGKNAAVIYNKIKSGEIPPPIRCNKKKKYVHCPLGKIPKPLSDVAMKAMAFDQKNRYHSVNEFKQEIENYQADIATAAEEAGWSRILCLLVKRNKILAISFTIILSFALYSYQQIKDRESLAQYRLAESHLAQGDVYTRSNEWYTAKKHYQISYDLFRELRQPTFPAEVRLFDVYKHAPDRLNSFVHPQIPTCFDISDNGRTLIAGNSNNRLILQDIVTGRKINSILRSKLESPPIAITLGPDQKYAYTGHYDGSVVIWDIIRGIELTVIKDAHEGPVYQVIPMLADGSVISAGADGVVKIWNSVSGQKKQTCCEHQSDIRVFEISKDNSMLLSGSTDGAVKLWDIPQGNLVASIQEISVEVLSLSGNFNFSNVAVGYRDGRVTVWNPHTDKSLSTMPRPVAVHSIQLLPDSKSLLVGYQDSSMVKFNTKTLESIDEYHGLYREINDMVFSRDGRIAALRRNSTNIDVIPVMQHEFVKFENHTPFVKCSTLSNDARLMASGGQNNTVNLWDVQTANILRTFSGHENIVTHIALSSDNTKMVTASLDKTLRVWDVNTGSILHTLEYKSSQFSKNELPIYDHPFEALALNSRMVISGDRIGNILFWDIESGKLVKRFATLDGPISSITVSPSGKKILAVERNMKVSLWNLKSNHLIWEQSIELLTCATLVPNRKSVVTGERNGTVRLWNIGSKNKSIEIGSSWSRITSVECSPNGRYVITGDKDGVITFWDIRTQKEIGNFKDHINNVNTVSFSSDGTKILSGGGNGEIIIYDFSRPQKYSLFRMEKRNWINLSDENIDNVLRYRSLGEWYAFRGVFDWAHVVLTKVKQENIPVSSFLMGQLQWDLGNNEAAANEFRSASSELPPYYINLLLNRLE